MRLRILPRSRWARIALIFLGLIFAPYLFSRAMSPWRQLAVFHGDARDSPRGEDFPEWRGLRVACYNIAHGRGVAESNWGGGSPAVRLARLEKIAALLREIDADVVVLNEVDFDSSWSHGLNQAEFLADKAGYAHRVEGRNLDFRLLFWTWRFGNAILSRFPISEAEVIDLPGYSRWESLLAGKKRAVLCHVRMYGKNVRVAGAHLSHRSERIRVASAEMVVEMAEIDEVPLILAGDLNSTPPGFPRSLHSELGRNAIDVLDGSGYFLRKPEDLPPKPSGLTFHSERPTSVIDWVMIPVGWRFDHHEVIGSSLSDHRPVLVEVSALVDPE